MNQLAGRAVSPEIYRLAHQAFNWFAEDRDMNGNCVWYLRSDAPSWVADLVLKAHGSAPFPDGTRFQIIAETLQSVVDYGDGRDVGLYVAQPDLRIKAGLDWLASHEFRADYVQMALRANPELPFTRILYQAEIMEREEVLRLLIDTLEAICP